MKWEIKDERLCKTFALTGFDEIIFGLEKIRKIANELNHHPDFEVYDYKFIRFKMYTHSSNSIGELDFQLAEKIDEKGLDKVLN